MMLKIKRVCAMALLLMSFAAQAIGQAANAGAQPGGGAQLKISGAGERPLEVSAEDLKKMPRKTVKTVNPHSQKAETYEGVALQEILQRAGLPAGENLRGAAMTSYVVVEASDGYKVVFSLAELDPGIGDAEVLVADTLDGVALDAKRGPLQLVAPHDKRAARWVRMVKGISVVQPGK